MGTRYEPPDAGPVSRRTRLRLRQCERAADRSIARSTASVSRHRVLPRIRRAASARPATFAQAYVIAHEIGHHVQNQLGTMEKFEQAAARSDARQRNAFSVRLELQLIATPACGGRMRRSATCWNRATWRKGCARRPPWATTRSRNGRKATRCPTLLRTARRNSGQMVPHRVRVRRPAQLQYVCRAGCVPVSARWRRDTFSSPAEPRCRPRKVTRRTTRSYSASTTIVTSSPRAVKTARLSRDTHCARIGTAPSPDAAGTGSSTRGS
jgi:hypothetical protein